MDKVQIGVVMTAKLAIALYTPPLGATPFVAAKLARAGIGEITVQAHLQSTHFLQMNDTRAPWVAGKTVWRCTRTSP